MKDVEKYLNKLVEAVKAADEIKILEAKVALLLLYGDRKIYYPHTVPYPQYPWGPPPIITWDETNQWRGFPNDIICAATNDTAPAK